MVQKDELALGFSDIHGFCSVITIFPVDQVSNISRATQQKALRITGMQGKKQPQ